MNRNKRRLAAAVLLFISMNSFAAPLEVKRFGIFIGANDGGKGRQRLLYAGDDALQMSQTMSDVGGIALADSILLLDPTAMEIRRELSQIGNEINQLGYLVRRTEVMFYYSGHSDENGLLVKGEQILYKEIRDELDQAGADVVIAVLDSCSSGAFTRTKGGQRRSPFLIDESSSMEGHAFLTSSSEDELSQESDRIGASFFTHYLISGLRGAADATGDGRVTLNEIYQHTFDETLSQTESTIGGPQHPSYEIQLTGTGDLVLTDLTVPTSALQLSGELDGRFSIRNSQGKLVAEFSKPLGDTLKLALPSGTYTIKKSDQRMDYSLDQENLMSAQVSLNRNTQLYLTQRDFSISGMEMTRYRGEEQPRHDSGEEKFIFSLLPGLNYPELNDDDTVLIQGGLIGSIAPRLSGLQISWLFNITGDYSRGIQYSNIFNIAEGSFDGIQASSIFNITKGQLNGIQGSGLFNIAKESLHGIQGAGVFNIAGMPSTGIQGAGVFNIAGEINGVQAAGVFNYSSYMQGLQASVVNVAGTSMGTQVGIVNVAREMHGLPIGLVNISRNGIVDAGVWYEYSDDYRIYTSFQSGTRALYTLFYFGNTKEAYLEDPENMVWGIHLGTRVPFGPLDIELDGGLKQSYQDSQRYKNSYSSVPSARALVALKGLGIYWGVTMDFQYPGQLESSLFTGDCVDFGSNGSFKGYYRYVFGIRI
ncbi:caspase family protein [Oceanispirochaeta sp.]|uniref:caspase family protein n=1 Tax=Oceanispirochaeta sp. TaxID=2035350 RepID=UPI00260B39F2|nr:caspase family protein [Oceanispirochaeta sp.]MDA3958091.1 caspase family protein [Oceanispirochaeta sp.]